MIFKQPNGKICLAGDYTLLYNLTEEEFIEHEKQKAEVKAKYMLQNPGNINDIIKYRKITDEQLKEMGYEKTYEEMMKYIPKRVVGGIYYGRDCTTYGKCPTCDAPVQDGIGYTDHKCNKCGQVLDWR